MTLVLTILKLGMIRWAIGKFFFSIIFLGIYMGITHLITSYFQVKIEFNILALYYILFITSYITSNLFGIGKFIFKMTMGSISIFSLAITALVLIQSNYERHQAEVFLGSFFVLLVIKLLSLFKVKRNLFILKSLKEVDKLGNGDTYEKGRLFEEYVAELYQQLGYDAVTTTTMRKNGQLPPSIQKRGGSGEQGVDVCFWDHVTKENVVVQCKHYSSKISNSAIQEIVASMPLYNAQRGIVVTNQYFTEPAKELALVNNVILVDRDELGRMIEYVSKNKKQPLRKVA